MTAKFGRRLATLEARAPARPAAIALDPVLLAGLTHEEAAEAARLWGRGRPCLRGRPARPSWDLEDLSCAELDRLNALVRKGHGLPPEEQPDYPYMGHFWRPCPDCRGRCAGPAE